MTRTLIAATAALLLASSASAQAPAVENRDLSPWSPLVYERLGATPKIQWRKAAATPAAVATGREAARSADSAPRVDAAKPQSPEAAPAAANSSAQASAAATAR